jgi:Cu(I)/Ag(I) efflux system membrane fusion protein
VLAFAAGVVALAGVLVVQHLRHGWPFSLHHGMPVQGAHAAHAAGASDAGPVGPARVPVDMAAERASAMGITLATVARHPLTGELRTVATVVPDEARVSHVHTRVSGWIDRLAVRTTGERVRAGATIGSIFSRELLASQTEYLTVRAAGPTSPITRGARERLRVLGMTDGEIAALDRRGTAERNVPIVAPRAGVVLERGVTVGAAVDPSTELFVIADLDEIWVLAEVPEARMAEVAVGTPATIELPSAGVTPLESTVEFVYPTLTEGTRTLRVRFALANPEGALRPGTYGSATFHLASRDALVVPRDAVVDTGIEQHVFIAEDDRFVPRTVTLGAALGDVVEITDGLREGDRVVGSGVFFLDSESRLRASGGGGAHAHGGHGAPTPAPPASSASDDDMSSMPGMGH